MNTLNTKLFMASEQCIFFTAHTSIAMTRDVQQAGTPGIGFLRRSRTSTVWSWFVEKTAAGIGLSYHRAINQQHYYSGLRLWKSLKNCCGWRKRCVDLGVKSFFITKTRLFKNTENFTSKKWTFSAKNFWYFSYFCSKHRLRVLVRTASMRRF